MDIAMLLLGALIGCLAALLLTWCLWRHGGAVEPFFMRVLQQEKRSEDRVDTRLMLHELLRKVDGLTSKTQRMDLELQELREQTLQLLPLLRGEPEKKSNLEEVCRLSREGMAADDIACQLQLGRGEVELLISLERKPDWVVSAGTTQSKV